MDIAVHLCSGHQRHPETGHAIVAVLDEALAAKEEGAERVILFSYSSSDPARLGAYEAYLHGHLTD